MARHQAPLHAVRPSPGPTGAPSPAAPTPAEPGVVQTVAPLPRHLTGEVSAGGYLESITLGILLLIAAVTVTAAWAATGIVRRRRGRPRTKGLPLLAGRIGTGAATFALTLAGVLVLVNAYVIQICLPLNPQANPLHG